MGKTAKVRNGLAGIALALTLIGLLMPAHSATAKEAIRIGVLSPGSGTFAAFGQYLREGFESYLKQVNYTVAGRKIEVVHEDDKMDPRTGLIKAKRLVEEMKVHAIAGVVSSAVAYAIKDYVVSNKIPFICTTATAENLTSRDFSPYFFRTTNAATQVPHVFADWLYKQGYRRVILMAPDYSTGYEHLGAFCRVFTAAGGEVVDEIYFPLGTIDFAPYLAKINPDKAAAVVASGAGNDAIHLVKQYAEYGLKEKIPLLSLTLITDDVLPQIGNAAVGIVDTFFAHFNDKGPSFLNTNEHKQFIRQFKETFGRAPIVSAESAYVGAQLIVKALEQIGGNVEDADAFIKAMEKVDIVAPRGPFKLDKFHNPVQNVYISVVKKTDSTLYFEIKETYPNVSQFWKWSPEEFMKMPAYKDVKGQCVKKK